MTAKRIVPGTILEIELKNNVYAYAVVLEKLEVSFFRNVGRKVEADVYSKIVEAGEAFTVVLHKTVMKCENWMVVGKIPPGEKLLSGRDYKMEYLGKTSIYSQKDGSIKPATQSEVSGLETASVWEQRHIEQRLLDIYEGVKF